MLRFRIEMLNRRFHNNTWVTISFISLSPKLEHALFFIAHCVWVQQSVYYEYSIIDRHFRRTIDALDIDVNDYQIMCYTFLLPEHIIIHKIASIWLILFSSS